MDKNSNNLQSHFLPVKDNSGFAMEDYWVWCGSVIRAEDGDYHMFASRWPKKLPFHPGWGVASEIVRCTSPAPEGPYTFAEVVLPARGAQYWDGRVTHNPSIQKYNDEYILFYTGSTFPYVDITPEDNLNHHSQQWLCARSNKRIGIATSKSIHGPWVRRDKPILDVRPQHFDNFLTSNPAPCINPDGSCLLMYKTRSYAPQPHTQGDMFTDMALSVAFADRYDGTYHVLVDEPLFTNDNGILEDPFIWRTDTGYAMIAKDWKGQYTKSIGDGVYGTSPDGIHWTIEPHTAYTCDIPWEDGTIHHVGNMDRPFILFDDDHQATHLFAATNDGSEAGFATMTKSWNMCIPLI